MAKVENVTAGRAKHARSCVTCGEPIEVGQRIYKWTPFRQPTIWKHEDHGYPKLSETDTSKMSEVYAATEDAESAIDAIPNMGDPTDLRETVGNIMGEAAERIRGVAEEYRESAEAMGAAGAEMEEKADSLEAWADDIDSFEPDTDVPDREDMLAEAVADQEDHGLEAEDAKVSDDDWNQAVQEYLDVLIDQAKSMINEVPV